MPTWVLHFKVESREERKAREVEEEWIRVKKGRGLRRDGRDLGEGYFSFEGFYEAVN